MPLTSDTALYDLQARTVLDGGVLYRDAVEPNFPGVVWLHLALRSLLGWSSEAIRIVDLLFVGCACILLVRSTNPSNNRASVLGLLAMAAFYLSRNEWCHCQRDSWMLLPIAGALLLRSRSLQVVPQQQAPHAVLRRLMAIGEGILWGVAFWIKPHVALSVIAVAAWSIWITAHKVQQIRRELFVLAGVILCAIPGIVWLVQTNAWSSFVEMQSDWNPEYLKAGAERRSWAKVFQLVQRFHPWYLIHVLSVPLAIRDLMVRDFRTQNSRVPIPHPGLLAVTYLSWFAQASLLQHAMDYIQVPPVLLGIAFLSARNWQSDPIPRLVSVGCFLAIALLASPQLRPERVQLWAQCFRDGSSTELRSRLSHGRQPSWNDLENVVSFLRDKDVEQGEFTSWNVHSIHAYTSLNLRPSTRYPCASILTELFPSHREEIRDTVASCGHKFVLTNADERPMSTTLTMSEAEFPWNLPVIYESGPFQLRSPE
ncbi:MAG: glycosyltransferase family 39 protein [Planctomyces sp.]|nr:glycosyltransferase family 39 protein [Planctomyces sp.]